MIIKPKISIAVLVYKSPAFADFVYKGIHENTPELKTGEAEFYFVLNFKQGESEKLLEHLNNKNYKFHNFNKNYNQPPYPQNIGEIYDAWNFAVFSSEAEIIVLLNSDMIPSDSNWLKDMLKCLSKKTVITARLIESGKMPSGEHGISKNFGKTLDSFDEKSFKIFAQSLKNNHLKAGGLFMPMMIHKENFLKAGGYQGNVLEIPGTDRYLGGDLIFFKKLREEFGVRHFTSFDSIFYHFQVGEVESNE